MIARRGLPGPSREVLLDEIKRNCRPRRIPLKKCTAGVLLLLNSRHNISGWRERELAGNHCRQPDSR